MVKERENILFIVNPISGRGVLKNLEKKINKSLNNKRFNTIIEHTQQAKHATTLAHEYLQNGVKKFVAVGGDGTVNEVASALMHTDATLGIIPVGSGNGFARHLRIPFDVDKAIKVINKEKIALIDVGEVNKQPFVCTAGVGFDAQVGNSFAQGTKRGFTNYVKATIQEFLGYKPNRYKITINNQTFEKVAFLITIANAAQYGNNAFIAPNADITDGKLDVTILSPFPKYISPLIGIKLFSKQIGKSRFVETFKVKEIAIEQLDSNVLHYDGEPIETNVPLNFSIKPLALKVFVP
ncbi:MAG TPA: diacylglycerol kinase family lipid kinase [Tenuifilaceae bacterium]|nr:diacylglycerol kinase family lipid kinase [Tenuifilaceae bacterium]